MSKEKAAPTVTSSGTAMKQQNDDSVTIAQATDVAPWTVAAGIRNRVDAALRMPPMRCGCADPDSLKHRAGRCDRRRGGRRG